MLFSRELRLWPSCKYAHVHMLCNELRETRHESVIHENVRIRFHPRLSSLLRCFILRPQIKNFAFKPQKTENATAVSALSSFSLAAPKRGKLKRSL